MVNGHLDAGGGLFELRAYVHHRATEDLNQSSRVGRKKVCCRKGWPFYDAALTDDGPAPSDPGGGRRMGSVM